MSQDDYLDLDEDMSVCTIITRCHSAIVTDSNYRH